jgi:hypothetical protein
MLLDVDRIHLDQDREQWQNGWTTISVQETFKFMKTMSSDFVEVFPKAHCFSIFSQLNGADISLTYFPSNYYNIVGCEV